MANDGKIYITISDRRFGRNKAEADEQNNRDKEKSKDENTLAKFAQHKFFNMIESQAKQAVNYSIANIGNFTGDYNAQTQTQEAISFLSFAVDVGISTWQGFKIGGVWGAVITAGIAIVGKGITIAEQSYAGYVANTRQNREINQLRTRAGLNSANNGSRGTEY